jgi:hypothetical protein
MRQLTTTEKYGTRIKSKVTGAESVITGRMSPAQAGIYGPAYSIQIMTGGEAGKKFGLPFANVDMFEVVE